MENLQIQKEYSNHIHCYVKDLWKEICITLSRQMDSNHSPGYHKWINIEFGLYYFIQPRYPPKVGAKGTLVLYVFISFGCDVS